jgi:hypothetical protein
MRVRSGRVAALLEEPPDGADLVIALERVAATARNREGHLTSGELDLQVIVLRLLRGPAQRLKEMDDIPPVDVVRGRMGEELIERAVVVRHVVELQK